MSRLPNNLNNVAAIFQRLQGGMEMGPLQQAAVDAQKATRTDIEKLFSDQARGFQENIKHGLGAKVAQQKAKLAERGIDPETLGLAGDFGAQREGDLVLGQLKDKLSGSRLDALMGISKNLANIFTGSTETGTRLLSQLLGDIDRFGLDNRRSTTGLNIRQTGFGPGGASRRASTMFLDFGG